MNESQAFEECFDMFFEVSPEGKIIDKETKEIISSPLYSKSLTSEVLTN